MKLFEITDKNHLGKFDAGNRSLMIPDYIQMKFHQLISAISTPVTDQSVQESRHAVNELIDAVNGQRVPLLGQNLSQSLYNLTNIVPVSDNST